MQASRTFTFSGGEDQLIDCEPSVRGLPLEHEAEVGGGADLHLAGRPFRPSCVEAFGSEYPFLKWEFVESSLKMPLEARFVFAHRLFS